MKLAKILKEIQIVPPAAPESVLRKKIKITSGNGEKETITAPPITKPEIRPIRRPLGNPDVDPKPKAESKIVDKITQRFNKLKG